MPLYSTVTSLFVVSPKCRWGRPRDQVSIDTPREPVEGSRRTCIFPSDTTSSALQGLAGTFRSDAPAAQTTETFRILHGSSSQAKTRLWPAPVGMPRWDPEEPSKRDGMNRRDVGAAERR